MLVMPSVIKLLIAAIVLCCSFASFAQEVQVNQVKGGIALSVSAQKPYQLMPGETKLPVLSLECLHKGKKSSHLVVFLPGGAVVDDASESSAKGGQLFVVTMDGKKQPTPWVPYGDTTSFAYFGKTDAERLQFIHALLGSAMVSIEFKPFLTGAATTSVFDLSKLREEMNKYPECSAQ